MIFTLIFGDNFSVSSKLLAMKVVGDNFSVTKFSKLLAMKVVEKN